jgi:hypothetical protein
MRAGRLGNWRRRAGKDRQACQAGDESACPVVDRQRPAASGVAHVRHVPAYRSFIRFSCWSGAVVIAPPVSSALLASASPHGQLERLPNAGALPVADGATRP